MTVFQCGRFLEFGTLCTDYYRVRRHANIPDEKQSRDHESKNKNKSRLKKISKLTLKIGIAKISDYDILSNRWWMLTSHEC